MRGAGVQPNLHTYTTVMNLYANVQALPLRSAVTACAVAVLSAAGEATQMFDLEAVVRLYAEMVEQGVEPDQVRVRLRSARSARTPLTTTGAERGRGVCGGAVAVQPGVDGVCAL
jgi:pentatricopeptide repeat protein